MELVNALITTVPDQLRDYRRQVINPGWMQLRTKQDSLSKYNAFVAVCNFIKAFATPEKTADQVFMALLRAATGDARRLLLRKAIDVLLSTATEHIDSGACATCVDLLPMELMGVPVACCELCRICAHAWVLSTIVCTLGPTTRMAVVSSQPTHLLVHTHVPTFPHTPPPFHNHPVCTQALRSGER